jgi:hypothetical protein
MGFNVAHWGTIASGQSFAVGYTFGGQNRGAQFAEGNPEDPLGDLISDQEGIYMDNGGGTNYRFQLTNIGPVTTTYGLDGGGLS